MSGTQSWQAKRRRIGRPARWLSWVTRVPRRGALGSFLVVILALFAHAARAGEEADEFVKALRDRGLDELTLDYLERMQTSRLAGDEFRRRIPYYRGLAQLALSRRAADPAVRTARLAEARAELERFAAANPDRAESGEAQIQVGGVLVELGRQASAAAGRLPEGAAYQGRREQLRSEARSFYTDADALFQRVASSYAIRLERAPPGGQQADEAEGGSRRDMRARAAQAQYLSANLKFEMAQTHDPSSSSYRPLHEAAAKALAAIADQYSSSQIWGYYARLDEGRCYQALGQYPLALGCYHEVLSRSSVLPAFRSLISRAYAYQAECQTATGKFDAAIEDCRTWLAEAKEGEANQPEWLGVRLQLAEALRRKGEAQPAQSLERRRLIAEARDAYRLVAATTSAHQPAARAALAALRGADGQQRAEPKTFAEAHELGREALSSANAAKQALPMAERNNPEAVGELKSQIDNGMDDARHYLQVALSLVDDDTARDDLNEVRYFLSWLHWEEGDYYRAAVLGDFLSHRYPDHAAAASAARIAIASYERLAQEAAATSGDRAEAEFAARRAAGVAEFVMRRWPGSRDAEAAVGVLVNYAIRNNRIDDAQRLLAELSPDDRPRLELHLGIAMWSRYLEQAQRAASTPGNDTSQAALKTEAMKYLRSGLDAARAAKQIDESTAAAAIYLAQVLLSDDKSADAITLLEDLQIGPLVLLARQDAAVARPEYAVQAYETALRAYVSVNPPRSDKVLQMIESLEKSVQAGGQQFAEQLPRIYLGLGVQLQRQIDVLREANRTAEADRVAAAFAEVLDRIAQRPNAASWTTRQWVAQSYYNLGTARDAETSAAPPTQTKSDASREYLTKARGIFQALLETAAQAEPPPAENALIAARFQLGECYRELGDFQQALDTFSALLKVKESSLAVQRAAALAYEQRGQAEGPQWLERAIYGGYEVRATSENRIWGWLKLAQVSDRAARSDPKYRDAFFEARFHMARCRYLIALEQNGDARKNDLAQAKQSVQSVARIYPEFDGGRWQAAFDALVKQIQTAAGEQALGLREFVSTN